MNRTCRHSLAAVLILFLGACAAEGPAPEAAGDTGDSRPNIVLIVADDAGYTDFGAFGDPEMPTPHIDAIAANGVRFTQGYNAASVCSPSRAGLVTGRYPQRFGHEFNIPRTAQPGADINNIGLPLSERTIADELSELGYHTVAIGKWHLGTADKFHPLERGFDEFFGFLYGSRSYFPLDGEREPAHGALLLRGHEPQAENGYMTDVLAAEAIRQMEARRDEPFFLYVNFNAVHTPMHATEEDLAAFAGIDDERRRALAAMTVSLDRAVGDMVSTLRTLGIEDNTLLLFVNDNGGATNNASINTPLRGQKGDKFEGGIRVPMLAQWPARLPRGDDYDYPVSSMDFLPTAVAAAGGTPSPDVDGVDLLPFLTGDNLQPPHRELFWRRGAIAAVRYVDGDDDYKLIRVDGTPRFLFDLAADPYERDNLLETGALGDEEAPRRAYLESALASWEEGTVEPLWRTDPFWTQNQIDKHTPETGQPPTFPQRRGYTPTAAGAPSTDIYLAELRSEDGDWSVGAPRNITDRDGYDNQPAFTPDGSGLLYASARNRVQSDVYRYDVATGNIRQVTQTTASEYSPTPLPDGDGFSAINESIDGQLLYRYAADGSPVEPILPDIQPVGYHAWGNNDQLIMFVLGGGGEPATLQLGSLEANAAEIIGENPGRSLHKVPGRHALSFVRKLSADEWWLEVLDLDTMEYTRLGQTLPGREDYAWTPDGTVIMGDETRLFQMRPGGEWEEIADFGGAGMRGISRLAISPNGDHIAIVGNR